jgi:prepilin-type N-terminal cleavage/methylation domain-containing protein
MKTNNAKNKTNARHESQRGFTLIETTISLLVMLVGSLAISSLFVFSTQNNVGGAERALAMAVAQQQLEQVRSVSFEDTTLNVGTTTTTVINGTRTYTVQRVVADEMNADLSAKNLKRITITVTPQSAGPNWTRLSVVLVAQRSTLATGNFAVQ